MGSVKAGHVLFAAAALHPVRAASCRRFVAALLGGKAGDGAGDEPVLEALTEHAAATLRAPPPHDDATALAWLLAEDLTSLLPERPQVAAAIRHWSDPRAALEAAVPPMIDALGRLGVELERPALHLVAELPAPYDHPSLSVISIDRSDAAAFGLAPGLHLVEGRMLPIATEMAIGHVLVHAALGQRSPEALGRGLEEGLAEVLGALHAAGHAASPAAIEKVFAALRFTPSLLPHREQILAWTRAATVLARRRGFEGLGRLVAAGRGAVKEAEAELGASGSGETAASGSSDPERLARLERLLAPAPAVAVRPLAYYLVRALAAGRRVDQAAADLGVPPAAAREAARELVDRAFVLVLGRDGEVLVDDLQLVVASRTLRYAVPGGRPE